MKIDSLLAKQLGIDPPGDILPVIIEYNDMKVARAGVSSLSGSGIKITGASSVLPMVYANMTKEQILSVQADPNVKRVYFSPRVGMMG